jgi:RNA polymerase sigma-B factor
MPLANRLARRYWGANEPLDDLRQVASLGLLKAIDRHDVSRGTSFQSFAVPTILGELKRYFRDCGWALHLPRGTQELALKVEQARRTLSTSGRTPSVHDLAEYLELTVEDIYTATEAAAAHHAVSSDAPSEDDDGDATTLGDSFGMTEAGYALVEDQVSIGRAAGVLSERERRVLALRFVSDLTQSEIASRIGVSQMQVSRILNAALEHLSAEMQSPSPS